MRFVSPLGLLWGLTGVWPVSAAPRRDANQWRVAQRAGNWWLEWPAAHPRVHVRLGAGGSIAEYRVGNGATPLPPSFDSETTDRVWQWTAWSDSLVHPVASLPRFEWRFNLTQAGDFAGHPTPMGTVSVERDSKHDPVALEIRAAPDKQWKTEQQSYFQACFATRTRLELRPGGVMWVRRFVRIGPIVAGGKPAGLRQLYLENWTPFACPDPAPSVVWHDGNSPPRRFQPGATLPDYPGWPLREAGFVAIGGASPFALAWPAHTDATFRRELNGLNWNQPNASGKRECGFAILPALRATDVIPGTIFEMNLALCPRLPNTPDARWLRDVQAIAAALPAWKRWPAGRNADGPKGGG